MIQIDLIDGVPGNSATAGLPHMIPGIREWLDKWLRPVWDIPKVSVQFVAGIKAANPLHWWIVVNGHSDLRGALGYHGVQPNGRPFGRIFALDDKEAGVDLAVTVTHELGEMLADPGANRTIKGPDGREYALEICDPIEDDLYSIECQGIRCSDFVYPSYYSGGKGPYDASRVLKSPCPSLSSGGYISFYDPGTGLWHQTFARLEGGGQSYRARRIGRTVLRAQNHALGVGAPEHG